VTSFHTYVFIYLFIFRRLFIYYDIVASNDTVISEYCIGNDLEGSGSDLILRRYRGIRLEELRKATIILSQDSRSQGRDLKPGPPSTKQKC
jgi:hypothetical protein